MIEKDLEMLAEHLGAGRTCESVRVGRDGRIEAVVWERKGCHRYDWLMLSGQCWEVGGELKHMLEMRDGRPLTIINPHGPIMSHPCHGAVSHLLTWGNAALRHVMAGDPYKMANGDYMISSYGWMDQRVCAADIDHLIRKAERQAS